jgi:hypothetical protein
MELEGVVQNAVIVPDDLTALAGRRKSGHH